MPEKLARRDAFLNAPLHLLSSFTTATASNSNGLNQVTQAGPTAIGYTPRGDVSSKGAQSYLYTSEDKLSAAVAVSYMIRDAFGRVIDYNDYAHGGTEYTLLNDGLDAIRDGPDRFVFAGTDEPIAWYDGSGARHFLHPDERGSIVAVTDSAGALTGINKYDDYGNAQGALTGKFGYTGQRFMSFTGLYDNRNRVYDPGEGRFMQTDPVGYADSPNLYAYVLNDPVNLVDPLGLCIGGGGYNNGLGPVCPRLSNDSPVSSLPSPTIGGLPGSGAGSGGCVGNCGTPGAPANPPADACSVVAAQTGQIRYSGTAESLVFGLGLTRTSGTFTNLRTGSTGHFVSYGAGPALNIGVGRVQGYYGSISNFIGYSEIAEAGVSLFSSALTLNAFITENANNDITAAGGGLSVSTPLPLPSWANRASASATASDTHICGCTVGPKQ